jgi:DNA (cytosine-5)-methyltransferase 1
MKKRPTFIDLFAGCGGLSEGFIQAGFLPLAHVEMDESACYSLKTRMAFHYLSKVKKTKTYSNYLSGKIKRDELYKVVPKKVVDSIINAEINTETIKNIFTNIDAIVNKKEVDLIIGGPPCQAYSLIGRARKADGMLNDKRNWLFKFYIRFLEKYKPKHFVFENVIGLLSAKDKTGTKYLDLMFAGFAAAGYRVSYSVISAREHGVPQNRKRIIIIGTKKNIKSIGLKLPSQKHKATITQIFKDLPSISAGDKSYSIIKKAKNRFPITLHKARPHNARDLKIYKIAIKKWISKKERLNYNDLPLKLQTHKNKTSFTDRFKVVAGELTFSHTVVAHLSKDGHYYIHPDIKQNRSISPREAARLQTFPDNYYFESVVAGKECLSSIFKQIGNAVPVYLAKQIAENIKKEMKK